MLPGNNDIRTKLPTLVHFRKGSHHRHKHSDRNPELCPVPGEGQGVVACGGGHDATFLFFFCEEEEGVTGAAFFEGAFFLIIYKCVCVDDEYFFLFLAMGGENTYTHTHTDRQTDRHTYQ
jgi:hypothetical protein